MAVWKKYILRRYITAVLIGCLMCGYRTDGEVSGRQAAESENAGKTEQLEKGYDLLPDIEEEREAEADCRNLMERYSHIYEKGCKDALPDGMLPEEVMRAIQGKAAETGCPVAALTAYSDMKNYERMEEVLEGCMAGKKGAVVVYEVHGDGGIGRKKFIFDGGEMYVVNARGGWNDGKPEDGAAFHSPGIPEMEFLSYVRIKEWKYTKKGWFGYELCVPEPPEVSEIVDAACLIRVKPMEKKLREMSERCLRGLGYQGNNLLCSDWDAGHMEGLGYNGLFGALHEMKFGEKPNPGDYPDGVPAEVFEGLMTEYLPVTAGQVKEYAAFDAERQKYVWEELNCLNYTPTFFATSLPEVTGLRENEDGTVTLTVEAVCDTVLCDDAVLTHELTVEFREDKSFRYLGNKIL